MDDITEDSTKKNGVYREEVHNGVQKINENQLNDPKLCERNVFVEKNGKKTQESVILESKIDNISFETIDTFSGSLEKPQPLETGSFVKKNKEIKKRTLKWKIENVAGGYFSDIAPLFTKDEKIIFVAFGSFVKVYNIQTGICIQTIGDLNQKDNLHLPKITAMALDPLNEYRVYLSDEEGAIKLWDWMDNNMLRLRYTRKKICYIALSPSTPSSDPHITRWILSQRKALEQRGSHLEFDLHKLKFISIFTRNSSNNHQEAINYARTHFPAFSNRYLKEIKQLMCLFCYTSNMSLFPYRQLYTPEHLWTSIQASFSREYCSLIGFSPDSPLHTVSIAGSLAIPTLLKMSSIMKEKKTEWTSQNELPVEIPLPSKYQFHSVFTCPVSKEQTTEANPPLMIPCGHVISKNSIERLSKDNPTNKFKCPYCPKETTPQEAILLYL
ncbi:hypothetical protein PCK2_000101 [Pneumocystis canis]|nr:hypothetical protein PCK2_000101 [Pneumocystis canis]